MQITKFDEEDRLVLMAHIKSLNNFLDERFGGGHDIVVLIHKQHEIGECQGTAVLSEAEIHDMAKVIRQADHMLTMAFAEHAPPPGTTYM